MNVSWVGLLAVLVLLVWLVTRAARGRPGRLDGSLLERHDANKKRAVFYPIVIVMFWFFFLLHWNGLLAVTYWLALERVNGTRSFLPQVTAAFFSAIIIFSVPVFLFEWTLRRRQQGRTPNK